MAADRVLTLGVTRGLSAAPSVSGVIGDVRGGILASVFGNAQPTQPLITDGDVQEGDVLTTPAGDRYRVVKVRAGRGGRTFADLSKEA